MSGVNKTLHIVSATVGALALIGAGFFFAFNQSLGAMVMPQTINGDVATSTHSVAQQESEVYCPSAMQLADTENYGDEDFQTSEGNLKSSSAKSIMGSLYAAEVTSIQGKNAQQWVSQTHDDADMTDSSVKYKESEAKESEVISTRTLKAKAFTGAAGTVMSWATTGDLKGISASNCIPFATQQSFFIPSSGTGWSQQLIVANSSDKSTTVSVSAYGAHDTTPLALATSSKVTVDAHEQTTVDLAAALDTRDAAYVSIESQSAPVAAVIRSVRMDGLTAKGSDYIEPLNPASDKQIIPAISGGKSVRLYVFGEHAGRVSVQFLGADGEIKSTDISYNRGRVYEQNLDIPDDTQAISLSSTSDIQASVMMYAISDDKDGQNDFAFAPAQTAHHAYGFAIPDKADVHFDITNPSQDEAKTRISGYNSEGKEVGSKNITLHARATARVKADDIAHDVAFITVGQRDDDSDKSSKVVVGATLSVAKLSESDVKARATITVPAMDKSTVEYKVTQKNTVLN